ncbi:MAG TPA: 2'-5' RNA ligase family protein, partial [Alloiococcus sp.]|nr:2'-5' RNA ligase family protein [Alloiococcus sp.]
MKYGIAIFPSKAIQDEANALRKRYDPEYAMIPPHITLKPGFNLGDTSISDITKILQEISNDTKPFKININKVSTFAPVTNTIYFKVDPEPELDALHKKIQESISSSD